MKPRLRALEERVSDVELNVEEYRSLLSTISEEALSVHKDMACLVDIGGGFCVQAVEENRDVIYIDVGLGFHVEYSLTEAEEFLRERVSTLEGNVRVMDEERKKVQQDIKWAERALMELEKMSTK
jgi:prefoldin alpha subunit